MASKIQLTPAELLAQSQEMLALQKEFEDLFKNTGTILGQVNSNWSEVLANNFMGKLQSAQKAFSQITSMLGQGGNLAATSAHTFESMDDLLAKNVAGGLLQDVAGKMSEVVTNAINGVTGKAGGLFDDLGNLMKDEWENLKEGWKETGNFLEWLGGKYSDIPGPIRNKIEGILGSQLTAAGSITYDIITGDVSWDTAEDFLSEIMENPYVDAVKGTFEYVFGGGIIEQQAAYDEASMQYFEEGNVVAGATIATGSFLDTIGLGVIDVGGGLVTGFVEGLPGFGLLQDALGFDLSDSWNNLMDDAHEGFSNMIESAGEHIAEFEEDVKDFVGDVYEGAKDFVGDVYDGAKEKLGEFASGAKDFFGKLF